MSVVWSFDELKEQSWGFGGSKNEFDFRCTMCRTLPRDFPVFYWGSLDKSHTLICKGCADQIGVGIIKDLSCVISGHRSLRRPSNTYDSGLSSLDFVFKQWWAENHTELSGKSITTNDLIKSFYSFYGPSRAFEETGFDYHRINAFPFTPMTHEHRSFFLFIESVGGESCFLGGEPYWRFRGPILDRVKPFRGELPKVITDALKDKGSSS